MGRYCSQHRSGSTSLLVDPVESIEPMFTGGFLVATTITTILPATVSWLFYDATTDTELERFETILPIPGVEVVTGNVVCNPAHDIRVTAQALPNLPIHTAMVPPP